MGTWICRRTLAAFAFAAAALPAQAQLKVEVTPYVWAVGVDADVTVAGQAADVDKSFSDLWDDLKYGGSLLGVVQNGPWVFYGQIDVLKTQTDLEGVPGGRLDTKSRIWTLAAGYQLQGSGGKTFDLLLGWRQLELKPELNLPGVPELSADRDVGDVVLMLRPSIPLSQNWRFNPAMSIGKGDSDKTYELWPQVQYGFSETWALRIGFRNLYYDIENEAGNRFKGSLRGLTLGLGGRF